MTSSITSSGDLTTYGQIVLFGDSITEQSFNPEYFGYGSGLANVYARKCDVINRGFSGYTTVQALDLRKRIFPERDDNVALVVLFFGANDAVLPGNQQHVPLEVFEENCRALLTCPPFKGKIIPVIPPPIEEYTHEPDFGLTRTAAETRRYGDALKIICKQNGIPYADVWSAFMSALDWKDDGVPLPGSMELPKNDKLASFFRDGLHPVGPGYRIIYNTIYAAICNHFPHLAADSMEPHTPYWSSATYPKPNHPVCWRLETKAWTDEKYKQCLSHIPKAEKDRIAKFLFPRDRYMALGSIMLQRHFISHILGYTLAPEDTIPRDDNNRPYYRHKAVRQHDFNVSHHNGTVVLVGVLESGRIGVDLTVPETLKQGETVASYLSSFEDSFSQAEWGEIGNDVTRFAQHWALKEAYVKYHGCGIVVDLTEIEFRHVKYVDAFQVIQTPAAQLYLRGIRQSLHFDLHFLEGAYVAVATTTEPDSSRDFIDITIEDMSKMAS